jgi:hypothetical protein
MSDVFVASNIPHDYPRTLQKPATVNDAVRSSAETFLLDSGIGDDTDNHDLVALAAEYEPDYIIPCDELHDQAATTAAVREWDDLAADHGIDATTLVPLQPPHHEHVADLPGRSHYALGGMAIEGVGDDQVVRWVRRFRETVGPEPYVHGLGIGGGKRIVRALAGEALLDSVDCATPELAAMFGAVIGPQLRQRDVLIHSGDRLQARTQPLAEFNAWQIQDAWRREAQHNDQQRLSEVTP